MKDTILAISGRSGLYKLLAQGKGNLIVENITDKKRMSIGGRNSVTAINDITMYANDEDTPLTNVFYNLFKANEGKCLSVNHKQATETELKEIMLIGLPNYDQDKVHISDMRKVVQWYNLLVNAGITDFIEMDSSSEND